MSQGRVFADGTIVLLFAERWNDFSSERSEQVRWKDLFNRTVQENMRRLFLQQVK